MDTVAGSAAGQVQAQVLAASGRSQAMPLKVTQAFARVIPLTLQCGQFLRHVVQFLLYGFV